MTKLLRVASVVVFSLVFLAACGGQTFEAPPGPGSGTTAPAGTGTAVEQLSQFSFINDVWGDSPDDVWAAGSRGQFLHWNGKTWQQMSLGSGVTILSLWGSSATDVWAVGHHHDAASDRYGQRIFRWNGTAWKNVTPTNEDVLLLEVNGSGPNDIWFLGTTPATADQQGEPRAYYFDGTTLAARAFPSQGNRWHRERSLGRR